MPECGRCGGKGEVVYRYRYPVKDGPVVGHYGDTYPAEYEVSPPRTCPVCLGKGRVRNKRPPRPEQGAIHFHIPSGLPPNTMSMDDIMSKLEERNQR